MHLIEPDYQFLKGNKEYWRVWGGAYGVVMEFCQENGLGDFGKPTPKGLKLMEDYEDLAKEWKT